MEGIAGTKKTSAEWVKNKFGLPWSKLISNAQAWKYGKEMSSRNETIDFIKFAKLNLNLNLMFHLFSLEMVKQDITLNREK